MGCGFGGQDRDGLLSGTAQFPSYGNTDFPTRPCLDLLRQATPDQRVVEYAAAIGVVGEGIGRLIADAGAAMIVIHHISAFPGAIIYPVGVKCGAVGIAVPDGVFAGTADTHCVGGKTFAGDGNGPAEDVADPLAGREAKLVGFGGPGHPG